MQVCVHGNGEYVSVIEGGVCGGGGGGGGVVREGVELVDSIDRGWVCCREDMFTLYLGQEMRQPVHVHVMYMMFMMYNL